MEIFVLGKTAQNIPTFLKFFFNSDFTIAVKDGDFYFALCVSRMQKNACDWELGQ